jgi:hypothetical protein
MCKKIGLWDLGWDRFNTLSSYAKASIKYKSCNKKLNQLWIVFLLWPCDWKYLLVYGP